MVKLLLVLGMIFFLLGTVGLFRFKDIYSRSHGAAKCDTLGALCCILALIIYSGVNSTTIKLLIVWVFLWITNPLATHLIVKAQYKKEKRVEK